MNDRAAREIAACVVCVSYCLLCAFYDLGFPYTMAGPPLAFWAVRYPHRGR